MEHDYIIELDSDEGKKFGFTSDLFKGYLWGKDNEIFISLITSKHPGQGNFSKLLQNIFAQGYKISVPVPLPQMCNILKKKQFKSYRVWNEDTKENIEVWHYDPDKPW